MRTATVTRNTNETKISLSLTLEGASHYNIHTGCGFFDHMLELFCRQGRFDLTLSCAGDTEVDYHHTVEDVGIALGRAFDEALADRAGITRYGDVTLPMDEALVLAAIDVCGRPTLNFEVELPTSKVGDFDTELVEEFFLAFTRELRCSLHFIKLAGRNTHHIAEACFKAFGRILGAAAAIDERLGGEIPSTKGTIL